MLRTDPVHNRGGPEKIDRYAVIDVGSNSIRLVIFEKLNRSLNVVFNEKVSCGLGSELSSTGRLAEQGVCQAVTNLVRFSRLVDSTNVKLVDVVATAAVRKTYPALSDKALETRARPPEWI